MCHLHVDRLSTCLTTLQKNYAPGSEERQKLLQALKEMSEQPPLEVPLVINGEKIKSGNTAQQFNPSEHKKAVCTYHQADASQIKKVS